MAAAAGSAARVAVTVVCVGRLREPFWRDAEAEYRKRLQAYTSRFTVIEVADEPTPDTASSAQEEAIRAREGERLRSKIGDRDHVVVLDRTGKTLDSPGFARHWEQATAQGEASTFTFVIGGSLGLDDATLARANLVLSFGAMTFPHQLMRVVLLEQIYRACKIQRKEPYHK